MESCNKNKQQFEKGMVIKKMRFLANQKSVSSTMSYVRKRKRAISFFCTLLVKDVHTVHEMISIDSCLPYLAPTWASSDGRMLCCAIILFFLFQPFMVLVVLLPHSLCV